MSCVVSLNQLTPINSVSYEVQSLPRSSVNTISFESSCRGMSRWKTMKNKNSENKLYNDTPPWAIKKSKRNVSLNWVEFFCRSDDLSYLCSLFSCLWWIRKHSDREISFRLFELFITQYWTTRWTMLKRVDNSWWRSVVHSDACLNTWLELALQLTFGLGQKLEWKRFLSRIILMNTWTSTQRSSTWPFN